MPFFLLPSHSPRRIRPLARAHTPSCTCGTHTWTCQEIAPACQYSPLGRLHAPTRAHVRPHTHMKARIQTKPQHSQNRNTHCNTATLQHCNTATLHSCRDTAPRVARGCATPSSISPTLSSGYLLLPPLYHCLCGSEQEVSNEVPSRAVRRAVASLPWRPCSPSWHALCVHCVCMPTSCAWQQTMRQRVAMRQRTMRLCLLAMCGKRGLNPALNG